MTDLNVLLFSKKKIGFAKKTNNNNRDKIKFLRFDLYWKKKEDLTHGYCKIRDGL